MCSVGRVLFGASLCGWTGRMINLSLTILNRLFLLFLLLLLQVFQLQCLNGALEQVRFVAERMKTTQCGRKFGRATGTDWIGTTVVTSAGRLACIQSNSSSRGRLKRALSSNHCRRFGWNGFRLIVCVCDAGTKRRTHWNVAHLSGWLSAITSGRPMVAVRSDETILNKQVGEFTFLLIATVRTTRSGDVSLGWRTVCIGRIAFNVDGWLHELLLLLLLLLMMVMMLMMLNRGQRTYAQVGRCVQHFMRYVHFQRMIRIVGDMLNCCWRLLWCRTTSGQGEPHRQWTRWVDGRQADLIHRIGLL